MFLDFSCCRGNRACGRDQRAFRSPFGNLRVATTGVDFFRSRGNRACGREGYSAFIVKVNVYLADIADLAAMNEAYVAFFGDHKPARKVVGCGELPFGARVMIDAIAGNWEGTPPVA